MLKIALRAKKDAVTGGQTKLLYEKLQNLYSLPHICSMAK
jgi:hypothetical protein